MAAITDALTPGSQPWPVAGAHHSRGRGPRRHDRPSGQGATPPSHDYQLRDERNVRARLQRLVSGRSVVDRHRIAELLDRIRDEAAALRRSGARPRDELFADPETLPAVKYRLVVAIEAATDVADHLIASEGFRLAAGYADSFRSLEEAGVLPPDLAAARLGADG